MLFNLKINKGRTVANPPQRSGIDSIDHPREWYCFADVMCAAHPCHQAFETYAKATVGDRAVFAQVEKPLVVFKGHLFGFHALQKQSWSSSRWEAANDLTKAIRGDQIAANTRSGLSGSASCKRP